MMKDIQIEENVRVLMELQKEQEKLSERIESIKTSLKNHMEESNIYELHGDDWEITWNMVATNRFSQKNFKALHPDIFNKFIELSESRRFIVRTL